VECGRLIFGFGVFFFFLISKLRVLQKVLRLREQTENAKETGSEEKGDINNEGLPNTQVLLICIVTPSGILLHNLVVEQQST